MISFFYLFFLLISSPFAVSPDSDVKSFQTKEKKNKRLDVFDFSKSYLQLEDIDIDATRKKNVELDLSGEFPVLESVNYEGTFGELVGKLTGQFSELSKVDFFCTNCEMNLDFTGKWEKSCEINVNCMKGNISLKLPQDVGVIVNTKVGLKGKVAAPDLKKKRKGVLSKIYKNSLAETAEVVLTVNVKTDEGAVLIK